MKPDKKYCVGCHDDYYNHDNNSTTGECWSFQRAKVINAYVIGWWVPMDKKENFYRITTHDCHIESGQRLFLKELPEHLRR